MNCCSIVIIITKEFKLQIEIKNTTNEKQVIEFQKEYIPCIQFTSNEIVFFKTNQQNSIYFLEEWFTDPTEYKVFEITFQNKNYCIIAEVLFALIINEIKDKIERHYIITDTIIQLPEDNRIFLTRIKIALQAINLKGIEIDETISFDYTKQGEILEELLEKNFITKKYYKMIEKARMIASNEQQLKLHSISKSLLSKETFSKEIMKLTPKERTQLHLCQLDNYCLFISSRYLNTLQDHINLSFVCKRLRCNMEKFHYNPISVNEQTISLFPNTETLNIYNQKDTYFEKGRIIKFCDWCEREYNEKERIQKRFPTKPIEFKNLRLEEFQFHYKMGTCIKIPDGIINDDK